MLTRPSLCGPSLMSAHYSFAFFAYPDVSLLQSPDGECPSFIHFLLCPSLCGLYSLLGHLLSMCRHPLRCRFFPVSQCTPSSVASRSKCPSLGLTPPIPDSSLPLQAPALRHPLQGCILPVSQHIISSASPEVSALHWVMSFPCPDVSSLCGPSSWAPLAFFPTQRAFAVVRQSHVRPRHVAGLSYPPCSA